MDRFPPDSGSRVGTIDALERLLVREAEPIADKALSGYYQMSRRRSIGELMADPGFARDFATLRNWAVATILADLVIAAEATLRYFAGHWRPRLAEALADLFAGVTERDRDDPTVAALRRRLHDAQKGPPAPPSEIAQAGAADILAALPETPHAAESAAFLSTLRFHFQARAEVLGQRFDGDKLVPALVLGAARAREET